MNILRTVGIGLFALGVALIVYSLGVYSQEPEAAAIYFLPGFFLLLTSGVLGWISVKRKRK